MTMLTVTQEWFAADLDVDDRRVREVIDRDAQICYRDWKSDLKDEFSKTSECQ